MKTPERGWGGGVQFAVTSTPGPPHRFERIPYTPSSTRATEHTPETQTCFHTRTFTKHVARPPKTPAAQQNTKHTALQGNSKLTRTAAASTRLESAVVQIPRSWIFHSARSVPESQSVPRQECVN